MSHRNAAFMENRLHSKTSKTFYAIINQKRIFRMPEVSRFLGIIIAFYYDEHNPPHFHIKYNEYRATFLINEFKIGDGFLPKKVLTLVLEWAYEHREELVVNWELAQNGKEPNKIKPLV